MFKFKYDITEKPQGHWRPEITFSFSWEDEDVKHNPLIKNVYLIAPQPLVDKVIPKNFIEAARNEIAKQSASQSVIVAMLINNPGGERWSLYRDPDLGSARVHQGYIKNNWMANIKIAEAGFINEKENKEFKFYAPWKDGATPDYSDVVPILMDLRNVVMGMLESGKSSGKSDGIGDELVYIDGQWVSEPEAEEIKAQNKKIRNIDL